MRKPPPGLRPLTKAERRRLASENSRALFPDVVLQRYEATCAELEKTLDRVMLDASRIVYETGSLSPDAFPGPTE